MWGVFFVLLWSRKPYLTLKTIFGTQLAPPDPSLGGALKGFWGSKLMLKDIWHEGCLLSTILVKEVRIDFKDIFWDPIDHPRPCLGGRGAQKGSRGSKLKLKDKCLVGCLFSTILVKEVVIDFKDIILEPNWPPQDRFLGGL